MKKFAWKAAGHFITISAKLKHNQFKARGKSYPIGLQTLCSSDKANSMDKESDDRLSLHIIINVWCIFYLTIRHNQNLWQTGGIQILCCAKR